MWQREDASREDLPLPVAELRAVVVAQEKRIATLELSSGGTRNAAAGRPLGWCCSRLSAAEWVTVSADGSRVV